MDDTPQTTQEQKPQFSRKMRPLLLLLLRISTAAAAAAPAAAAVVAKDSVDATFAVEEHARVVAGGCNRRPVPPHQQPKRQRRWRAGAQRRILLR